MLQCSTSKGTTLAFLSGAEVSPCLHCSTSFGLMIASREDEWPSVSVDVCGYKRRRHVALEELARKLADQAKYRRRPVTLEPMPPDERRVVHIALANNPDCLYGEHWRGKRTQGRHPPQEGLGMFKSVDSEGALSRKLRWRCFASGRRTVRFQKSIELATASPSTLSTTARPTTNGSPGIHHVLSRLFKDIPCRYKTMRGYCAPRKAGWDTHGLPVELKVEHSLGSEEQEADRRVRRCRVQRTL